MFVFQRTRLDGNCFRMHKDKPGSNPIQPDDQDRPDFYAKIVDPVTELTTTNHPLNIMVINEITILMCMQ